jgi:hypothetical protein
MRPCLLLAALALPPVAAAAEPAPRPHWAFQPPTRPDLPTVRGREWVRTPVDVFILARLERAGRRPAPPADRLMLLRRVTFDLTGLPPTPEEQEAFLRDGSPGAYERVVERLLASPHYGERWAQHWLDVARYAETNGYEGDAERPQAWRYRDYVVRALNDDKPYDRFVTEQLAGDLLARTADGPARKAELLVAAGFNRCGPVHQVGGNVDPAVLRQEVLTEMTSAVGAAFLGLTVGCARCHDHKSDPIPQADYYRLQAFFSAAKPREVDLATPAERADFERRAKELNAALAPLRRELSALEAPYKERLREAKKAKLEPAYREALAAEPKKRTPEQKRLAADAEVLLKVTWDEVVAALSPADRDRRAALRRRIHELEAHKPAAPAQAWTLADGGGPLGAHVLKRGNPHNEGARVGPDVPRALRRAAKDTAGAPRDRVELARWLTRPDHPLTARVIVNRLWQHHFGRGLVRTPNDFGARGEPPTHPELLDWLAAELVRGGWSLKHLHRLMVLSNTYRQSSRNGEWGMGNGESSAPAPANARPSSSIPHSPFRTPHSVDPDNRLLSRMNRRRLGGEALRDNALAVSGELDRRLGGPMVRVPLEPEVYELIFTEGEPDGLWPVTPDARAHARRSLYLFNKRNVRLPLLEAFDQPDTLTSCPVRPVSTYAPQALILLNGPFMQGRAKAFAARLACAAGPAAAERVGRAYRLALGRPPKPAELRLALDFLAGQAKLLRGRPDAEAAALTDFCLALLNCNEFLYVE